MRLFAFAVALAALPAAAQHTHPGAPADAAARAPVAGLSTGLRVDEAAPPPGSAIGRATLRWPDGGYATVVFGRPFLRGRQPFGGVVAYDSAWAAGAHVSTELWTTVPLAVGGRTLAPGGYALFVTPRAAGAWTLHVNHTLGMHLADEYDPAHDVATADAVPTALAAPVQALTWAWADDATTLTLSWGTVEVRFPAARAAR